MLRDLLLIIRSDRMDSDWQRVHDLDYSICHGLSGLTFDFSQEGKARLLLDQGDNGMTIPFSDTRIHSCHLESAPLFARSTSFVVSPKRPKGKTRLLDTLKFRMARF